MQLDREAEEFANAMLGSRAEVFVIAEEAGWDVVPVMPSGRLFRDVLGRMKQQLAARARSVYLVASGFALDLRSLGTRIE
jgi:adenosylcobinamide kinase/adenosylcobinamide-phosphate guanylyltransferase